MMKSIRHLLLALCAVTVLAAMPVLAAGAIPEYTLKVGYLYNFALLTEWPGQNTDASFEMCFYRQEGFDEVLDTMRGKIVNGQPINIRHISKPAEATQCKLLFVSEIDRNQLRQLMESIAGLPVLTITDDGNLARSGVMVFLKPDNHRLAFDINLGVAKQAKLNISSRLLRLAKDIVTK